MKNTKTTCTSCKTPLINQAANGRPDVWAHTTVTEPHCYTPNPPYEIEQALPREIRKVRIRVQELITYEVEKKIEVHTGVTMEELPDCLTANTEGWADDIEDHFLAACDREVLDEDYTYFTDNAGYLAKLALQIEVWPKHIVKWLTLTCPVCGVQPGADDSRHQSVGWFVGIACNGMRVVNPAFINMEGTGWEDWTEQTVDASGKAGQ
ncbi:hypothetical protein GBF35_25635 [Nonomuraea phyllanthi]|uniref:hypothetical protein n=1 Tax=Nonomuraea phyllanthi TaxID=2219224 RepID=UPI001293B25E|nr:hypothetical protein [Nonomuraea phyllanthi]QFY09582.1 hypothetical protein GBF35_25635 [Nonomuraea phyllanthi]